MIKLENMAHALLSRLAMRITAIRTRLMPIRPGMPTWSAKPVVGRAVAVACRVGVAEAAPPCGFAAITVAVAG